ncbi:MAG: toll/interleukin-1 receptor domain-containing protein [Lachnospiraceae bacterium]|nr:toll/interleukin-1 receptor domain-containing protein [Lachnospiraceae bacterium]
MYLFLSHSSKEYDIAEKICDYLENHGHSCFLAPRDIRSGHIYAQEIMEGIESTDAMLVLLSKASNESPHVLREVESAVSKNKTVFVYQLEEVELSKSLQYFLMTHQWIGKFSDGNYDGILQSITQYGEPNGERRGIGKDRCDKANTGRKQFKWVLWPVLLLVAVGLFICCINKGEKAKEQALINEETAQTWKPGERIVFGRYGQEDICWRVLRVSQNGKEAILIAENILSMKAYDAAESGKYNEALDTNYWGKDISGMDLDLQHQLRGNNDWETSNIRTWLNSADENVTYENGIPQASAMSELKNGYHKEPGFLSYFTEAEQKDSLVTKVETNGKETEDKVFLLSSEELEWLEEANVSRLAVPTEYALVQDKADWYDSYALELGAEDFYWWLRDSSATNGYQAYMVCSSISQEEIRAESVGLEGYGIRPVLTIRTDSEIVKRIER